MFKLLAIVSSEATIEARDRSACLLLERLQLRSLSLPCRSTAMSSNQAAASCYFFDQQQQQQCECEQLNKLLYEAKTASKHITKKRQ